MVDANVVAKWFINEDLSSQALTLASSPVDLLAPDLLVSEVANVFLKKVRNGAMSLVIVGPSLDSIADHMVLIPAGDIVEEAFAIAHRYGRSLYDSLYVALAQREGIQLITADLRLFNALHSEFPGVMVYLADV